MAHSYLLVRWSLTEKAAVRCPGPGGPPTANIVAEKVGVYPLKPGGTTGSNNPVRLRIWNYFLDPSQDRIGRFLSIDRSRPPTSP